MALSDAIDRALEYVAFVRVHREGGAGAEGSGFVVSSDGRVATVAHLLRDARRIEVSVLGGRGPHPASVLETDVAADTALLKVEARDWRHARLHRGPPIGLGQEVAILGFPHSDLFARAGGNPLAMAMRGIVGSRYRLGGCDNYVIDIPASQGMSGGPLVLASSGDVIGVVRGRFEPERVRASLDGRAQEEVLSMPAEWARILFAPSVEYLLALMRKRA
jgi:S1-C subfamily serine protease